jgi:thiamine pyrophosphokinase
MIKILQLLSGYKSILCLDGSLECDIIGKLCLPVVAADGAANTLIKNGIEPFVIVGDLDSVDSDLLQGRKYVKYESQDSTDFEKALHYIEKESLSPPIIFGVGGGCIDHVLGNIAIFCGTKFAAVSDGIVFMTVDEGSRNFNLKANTKLSIFGMPSCVIRSEGLKWELREDELSFCGKNSLSNRAISDCVKLEILSGKALVFIYTKTVSDAGDLGKGR